MPKVLETDVHATHIYTHYQVVPKTWATWLHINWHEELLAKQKAMEQQAQQMQMMNESSPPAGQLKTGVEKRNSKAQASPLKTEINSSNNNK